MVVDLNSGTKNETKINRTESAMLSGDVLVSKVKELIHEGSVRRIVLKDDDGHTVLEIPVLAGVIAAVAAPIVTAVGAVAALANSWRIEVHRHDASTTDHQS